MNAAPVDLLETVTQRAVRRRPGVVIGAQIADQRVLRSAGTLEVDSVVEIGSITKVFTAMLLAEAVVRGEVTLQTPLQELLPPGTPVPMRDGVEITLEHLATHRSGLPGSPTGLPVVPATIEMLRGRNPYAGFETADLLAGLAATTLRRAPGTGKPAYSNTGFGVLGLALSLAAVTSYDDLVAQRICAPLGLTDTVTPATASADHRARWATGHSRWGREVEDWTLTGIAGAGSLRSTGADMLTFLTHQLEPTGSPLEEAIRLTQERRVQRGRSGVGLAWHRLEHGSVVLHNGGTGGFRSIVVFRPGRGRAVVALTNSTWGMDRAALRLLNDLDGQRTSAPL